MSKLNAIERERVWQGSVIGCIVLFIMLHTYAVSQDFYLLAGIPVAVAVIAYAFVKPRGMFMLLVALTPFTFAYEIDGLGATISLPTEPMILGMMLLFYFKFFLRGKISLQAVKHPVSIVIGLSLAWMFISCIFSSMPMVSWKYFLSRFWFISVFYILALQIFKDASRIKQFLWLASISLTLVAIYTMLNHSTQNFSHQFSYDAAWPFFKDHNIYGVIVAFLVPVTGVMFFKAKSLQLSSFAKWSYGFMTLLLTTAVILSYTRAAWLSLVIAFGALLLFRLRVRLRTILLSLFVLVGGLAIYSNDIIIYLNKNNTESDTDFKKHLQSIYNVTTDDSNTERLNRWNSAIRMFQQRPVFGWGANTYQFKYAPFQLSREKTLISTNLGDQGNAHSEFLGPLAEQGFLGLVFVVALMLIGVHKGMQLYYHGKNNTVKYLALAIGLSLITYYAHGFLNNYLDSDKANVLFWASFAALCALETYHNKPVDIAPAPSSIEGS